MAVRVRLLLKGRQLQEVPLGDAPLRIGRMKENDLVVNNLAVSRFHATLGQDGDGFYIEDTGSENGLYVNGERVDRCAIAPGDEIRIGKHDLRLVTDAESDAEIATRAVESSDPWDAANTYFAGNETGAAMLGTEVGADHSTQDADDAIAPASEEELPLIAEADAAPEFEDPDEDLFGEVSQGESLADSEEVSEPVHGEISAAPLPDLAPPEPLDALAEPEPETALLGDGPLGDTASHERPLVELDPVDSSEIPADPEDAPAEDAAEPEVLATNHWVASGSDAEEPEAEPETALLEAPDLFVPEAESIASSEEPETRLIEEEPVPDGSSSSEDSEEAQPETHAGLIMQREGKLERILSWDEDRMSVGRGQECDIVLPVAEVSRNHAMLVRQDDTYEVRDLDSSNGTYVNGERVSRRTLAVGDVVQVEVFEFTFVLESHPIGDEIKTEAPPRPEMPSEDPNQFTQLDEVIDLAPYAVEEPAAAEPESSIGWSETATRDEMPSAPSLTPEAGDDILVAPAETAALPAMDLAVAPESDLDLDVAAGEKEEAEEATLEIRVRRENLPVALRAALDESPDGVLRFEASVVLRADGD